MQVDLPDSVDIIIVGGGIVGTSISYFLTEETDQSVLLLEKNNIASGSTGDSSAIIRHHYGPMEIYTKMAQWSHDFYRDFDDRTGQPLAYNQSPLIRLGIDDEKSGDYALEGYETLSSLNIPVEHLGRSSLEAEFPMLEFEETDFGVVDETAAYSDATDVAVGFARSAQDRGAVVRTGVEVTDVEIEDDHAAMVRTTEGAVKTDQLIVAAGPWTDRLMESIGVDIPIERSREQILILEKPEGFDEMYPDGLPTSSPPDAEWYTRDDFVDAVLVATHTHGSDGDVDPDTYTNSVDETVKLELIDELTSFCPELETARLQGEYCGVYSNTPDYDFILDQVESGCYVACGFSGHGFKHGPAIGRIMTDLVLRGESDLVDVDYFGLDRFEENAEGHGNPEDSA